MKGKIYITFRLLLVLVSAFLLTDLAWADSMHKNSQVFERELEEEDVDNVDEWEESVVCKIDGSNGGGDQYDSPDITAEEHKSPEAFSFIHSNESIIKISLTPSLRVRLCILYCNLKICSLL